jgi:hypothetical protein
MDVLSRDEGRRYSAATPTLDVVIFYFDRTAMTGTEDHVVPVEQFCGGEVFINRQIDAEFGPIDQSGPLRADGQTDLEPAGYVLVFGRARLRLGITKDDRDSHDIVLRRTDQSIEFECSAFE